MTDLNKIVTEYAKRKANRREFLTRLGSAGLGIGAGTLIAGCGGGGNGFGSASAAGSGGFVDQAELQRAFRDIQLDENDHVTFLKAALGANARPRPQFDPNLLDLRKNPAFGAATTQNLIAATAALENTGTGAYPYVITNPNFASTAPIATGAGNLSGIQIAQAAATIAIVEGRHAGFANALLGRVLLTDPNQNDAVGPSNNSREVVQPPSQVATRAHAFLGNISTGSAPAAPPPPATPVVNTYLRGYAYNPNGAFTAGGGTPAGTAVPGDDVNTNAAIDLFGILNYALLLEYLERDFYNLNVPLVLGTATPGAPAYNSDPTTP